MTITITPAESLFVKLTVMETHPPAGSITVNMTSFLVNLNI